MNKEELKLAEYYDVYNKDLWKDPSYRLMDKFSLKGKKGFVTGGGGGIGRSTAAALGGSRRRRGAGGYPRCQRTRGGHGQGDERKIRRQGHRPVLRCIRQGSRSIS